MKTFKVIERTVEICLVGVAILAFIFLVLTGPRNIYEWQELEIVAYTFKGFAALSGATIGILSIEIFELDRKNKRLHREVKKLKQERR